ncbi:hypothetical protein SAMN02927924_01954 [Sphingobium faniae]|nr:hypothetical protein SAMN02927924_01954 [Sphingobium faniae]
MSKPIRVVQWGLGYIGTPAIRYILDNPSLELVGMKCFTPEKAGRTAGEIAGRAPGGVRATQSVEEILALEADCVLYMPRDAMSDPSIADSPSAAWVPDLLALLESGKNVISPIPSCTHWRHLQNGEELRDRFDAACARGNSTLFFTGMDPGFNTDVLPFILSSAVGSVNAIRTFEIIDYGAYTVEPVLRQLGFGGELDHIQYAKPHFHAVWGGAIHVLAEALGVTIDRIEVHCEGLVADETYVSQGGMRIEAGKIAAYRFWVTGYVGDRAFIDIQHVTRMGHHLAPHWPTMGHDGGYRIEIDGFPPFQVDLLMGLRGGTGTSLDDAMTMTSARCVHAIPAVMRASPGYKTFLDLGIIGGRAAGVAGDE